MIMFDVWHKYSNRSKLRNKYNFYRAQNQKGTQNSQGKVNRLFGLIKLGYVCVCK